MVGPEDGNEGKKSRNLPDGTLRRQEPFHRECFYVTGTRLSYLLFTFPQSSSFKETSGCSWSLFHNSCLDHEPLVGKKVEEDRDGWR